MIPFFTRRFVASMLLVFILTFWWALRLGDGNITPPPAGDAEYARELGYYYGRAYGVPFTIAFVVTAWQLLVWAVIWQIRVEFAARRFQR